MPIFLARIFTKVEGASLDEIVLVLDVGVSVLVVRGVLDRLHEASVRRVERHVGIWSTLGCVGVLQSSVILQSIVGVKLIPTFVLSIHVGSMMKAHP